jgi:hypothetical protein
MVVKKIRRPKKQFCPVGHDTFVVGRTTNNRCRICARKADAIHSKKNRKQKNRWVSQSTWKNDYKIVNSDGSQFTLIDYDRLYQVQQGRCAICKRHQTELKRVMAVDHSHETGIVRGLLCDKCNRCLGFANDSIEILKRSINYLETVVVSQKLEE